MKVLSEGDFMPISFQILSKNRKTKMRIFSSQDAILVNLEQHFYKPDIKKKHKTA